MGRPKSTGPNPLQGKAGSTTRTHLIGAVHFGRTRLQPKSNGLIRPAGIINHIMIRHSDPVRNIRFFFFFRPFLSGAIYTAVAGEEQNSCLVFLSLALTHSCRFAHGEIEHIRPCRRLLRDHLNKTLFPSPKPSSPPRFARYQESLFLVQRWSSNPVCPLSSLAVPLGSVNPNSLSSFLVEFDENFDRFLVLESGKF